MIETSQQSKCIEHTGYIKPNGYGQVGTTKYGTRYAHRVAWIEANGPIPGGLDIDHLCRNRACVNVEHLEPVPPDENIRRGLNAKLTKDSVKEIRELYATNKYTQQKIADIAIVFDARSVSPCLFFGCFYHLNPSGRGIEQLHAPAQSSMDYINSSESPE